MQKLLLHLVEEKSLKKATCSQKTIKASNSDDSSLQSMNIVAEIVPSEKAKFLEDRVYPCQNLIYFSKRVIFETLIDVIEQVSAETIES